MVALWRALSTRVRLWNDVMREAPCLCVMIRNAPMIGIGRFVFKRGGGSLSTNFRRMGHRPPTTVGIRKLDSLDYHVALFEGS